MFKQRTNLGRFVLILLALLLGTIFMLQNVPASQAATITDTKDQPHINNMFSDVTTTDPNLIYINYLNHSGIIAGFPDGNYHPDEGLTRAQAAVVVARAAGLKTATVNKSRFRDVPINHWASPYIEAVENEGYIESFQGDLYQPDGKLTRAQAVSLIMRLGTQGDRAALPALKDIKPDHWAAQEIATAIAMEMIGISRDGTMVYPDAEMTRSDLARALAILLTKDPEINKVSLTGKIKDPVGDISLIRNGSTQPLVNDMSIVQGDIIKSGNGKAEILYPDGSSALVETNSELIIRKATGRNYIKLDGTPGIAVDYLNIEMKQGTLFGALATKHEADINKQAGITPRFAALNSMELLAATEKGVPWYKTAETKKVKVKVDMPWGIAAIRGTFYKVIVDQDGSCNVSCLTGSTEVTSSSGGTVTLSGNQSSAITDQANNPAPATPMSPADAQAFASQQQWVVDTAVNIDLNQEAPVLEMIIEGPGALPVVNNQQNVQPEVTTTLTVIINALQASGVTLTSQTVESIKQQLQQIQENSVNPYQNQVIPTPSQSSSSSPTSSSGSSGSSGSSSIVSLTYSTAGTYGGSSSSSPTCADTVTINASGVTLQNMVISTTMIVNCDNTTLNNVTINGNLVLGAGIAEGDVTMNNVTVSDNTTINGGGNASIHITDSQLGTVTVNKTTNDVRVVAEGNTSMGTLTLNSGAILEESGLDTRAEGFTNVITGSGITSGSTMILKGNFSSFNITQPGLTIILESGSIASITIGGAALNTSITMAAGTTVQSLTANGPVTITGAGQISIAHINVNGVNIATMPTKTEFADGISAVINDETEDSGSGNSADGDISSSDSSISTTLAFVNMLSLTGNLDSSYDIPQINLGSGIVDIDPTSGQFPAATDDTKIVAVEAFDSIGRQHTVYCRFFKTSNASAVTVLSKWACDLSLTPSFDRNPNFVAGTDFGTPVDILTASQSCPASVTLNSTSAIVRVYDIQFDSDGVIANQSPNAQPWLAQLQLIIHDSVINQADSEDLTCTLDLTKITQYYDADTLSNQALSDLNVDMTLNGNSLVSIMIGTNPLILNVDYSVTGYAVTIKKEYLSALPAGITTLTFNFSA